MILRKLKHQMREKWYGKYEHFKVQVIKVGQKFYWVVDSDHHNIRYESKWEGDSGYYSSLIEARDEAIQYMNFCIGKGL